MNIQVSTDHNIKGSALLNSYVVETLTSALERFKGIITRVEVHLTDENAAKSGGQDKRCLMEARVAHHQPIIVRHNADNIHQAIQETSDKLERSISSLMEKTRERTGLSEFSPVPEVSQENIDENLI